MARLSENKREFFFSSASAKKAKYNQPLTFWQNIFMLFDTLVLTLFSYLVNLNVYLSFLYGPTKLGWLDQILLYRFSS